MLWTHTADVGDGLCMAICTIFGKAIQIDCGSQGAAEAAVLGLERIRRHFPLSPLNGPDAFCLSHFHADHYNGLLEASMNPNRTAKFSIKHVYYPRIPKFKERDEFLKDIFTMNLRLLGDETGVMEYDLLETIQRINLVQFCHRPLSKDEIVEVDGSFLHVLWPPGEIRGKSLARIRRALRDFRKALEEDREMSELYERVAEERRFKEYLKEGRKEPLEYRIERRERKKALPEVTRKANKSLRRAANNLSLALVQDNRFLFLGDTEGREIRQIIEDLSSRRRSRFQVLIAPHHGTHWHRRLREIDCIYSVSSAGRRGIRKVNPIYKSISRISLCTYVNGDVIVPTLTGGRWRYPFPPRHWI